MLHHLKKWLAQISIARPPPAKPTLIMELVPAIKEGIEKQVNCTLKVSAPGESMFGKVLDCHSCCPTKRSQIN